MKCRNQHQRCLGIDDEFDFKNNKPVLDADIPTAVGTEKPPRGRDQKNTGTGNAVRSLSNN